jgi:hypothetical protein
MSLEFHNLNKFVIQNTDFLVQWKNSLKGTINIFEKKKNKNILN